jgi:hypothetical protein
LAAGRGARVWVTSDAGGSTILPSGRTDANGQVTFYLDAGTIYVWRQKAGWNLVNPDEELVATWEGTQQETRFYTQNWVSEPPTKGDRHHDASHLSPSIVLRLPSAPIDH